VNGDAEATATSLRVDVLQHRLPPVAEAIVAVLRPAYAQEARLLGAVDFPPLQRTADDVAASHDFHLGAWVGAALVGALALGPDDETDQLCIGTLVVHPGHQRLGVASALLRDLLLRCEGFTLTVATGAANAPALALYQRFGFVTYRRGVVGNPPIALLKLRRAASGMTAA
jgi:GNAT superfamily N-acetyltransferase